MATQDETHHEEDTFRHYTPDQAQTYAAERYSNHANLHNVILDHHASTGGRFATLMDVGCGPGTTTRPLAQRFDTAHGADPSPEMINTAKKLSMESQGGETASGKKIDFLVARAEDLGRSDWNFADQVDLLTAGSAAHWFDMGRFWASAARVVKEGGTVALWTNSRLCPHPSTPNVTHFKEIFQIFLRRLEPYESSGNQISERGYDDLTLPWDAHPPAPAFPRDGFTRLTWDRDGHLSDGKHFFLGEERVTLAQLQKKLGIVSMVTRWRAAHQIWPIPIKT